MVHYICRKFKWKKDHSAVRSIVCDRVHHTKEKKCVWVTDLMHVHMNIHFYVPYSIITLCVLDWDAGASHSLRAGAELHMSFSHQTSHNDTMSAFANIIYHSVCGRNFCAATTSYCVMGARTIADQQIYYRSQRWRRRLAQRPCSKALNLRAYIGT